MDTSDPMTWINNKERSKVWSDMTVEARNYWGTFYGNLKDKFKRIITFYDVEATDKISNKELNKHNEDKK